MRVLIVEDEYLIARDAADTLEEAGCEIVDIAGSVTMALKAVADNSFDAALVDANLGGESAEPVATALSQKGIPFLIVTGYGNEQRQGVLAEAPFLSKPYVASVLANTILAMRKVKRSL
jgi:DNA-binding response OmpR family regulator